MTTSHTTRAYSEVSLRHARDELILAHVEFARHVVRRTVANLPGGTDLENLESAGMLGLVEASQRFDESRGIDFRSFAYPRVRGAVLDELRRNSPLSKQMIEKVTKVRRACEVLEPPVTPDAIAQFCDLKTSEVEDCLLAMQMTRSESYEESAIKGVRRQSVGEPIDLLELNETQHQLADCIELLPEQERIVLTLYHLEDLRLREVGEVLGLSESRISRVLAKAEFQLAQLINARTNA